MADTATLDQNSGASDGYQIFRTSTAPSLDETGHMELVNATPEQEQGIATALEAGFAEGNVVKTLFSQPGFSLTYAWFKSGFPLPLHTHNADCMYYVLSGTLQLGKDTLGAGDGFFIPSDKAYRYTPGPEGVEVLEFRHAEDFNIDFMAKSLGFWEKISANIAERRDGWAKEVPPSTVKA